MDKLQELRQKYAALCDEQKAIVDKAVEEDRVVSEEEQANFDGLQVKIDDMAGKIKTAELAQSLNIRNQALDETDGEPYRPVIPGAPSQNNKKLNDGGFKSLGEMLHALRWGDPKNRIHELSENKNGQGGGYEVPDAFKSQLLPRIRNEWSMGVGEEGGFAVPVQQRNEVMMYRPQGEIVRPLAQVIPAGDPPDAAITMPALSQGANGVYAGVQINWIGEGDPKPETDAKLREITLTPYEAAAHTVVTDKLLRNWAAANTFISTLLRNAVSGESDRVSFLGTGIGQPTGIINAPGTIAVNRAVANQVGFGDVSRMLQALMPESLSSAIWVASQSVMSQLVTMQDGAGNSIFIRGDVTKSIPDTLYGLPIRWTGRVPTLGNRGDIGLYDFGSYIIKDGSGPFIAASEHVLFRQNKTVVKIFYLVDGKPWIVEPLTLEDGVTQVSPFVVLDVPAP